MRERFTDEEWALVRHIPVDAFIFVAAADDKIDAKEHEEFMWTLEHGPQIPDPLHSEIARDIAAGGQAGITAEQRFIEAESVEDLEARINRSKAVLKAKLTRDEYQSFLLSVLRSGVLVAGASKSKGGLLHRQQTNISEEELKGLMVFATAFDLDVDLVKQALQG